jgi:hypothetical protein
LAQNVDSRYSPAQWQGWINLGKYDPSTHKFRSERTGPNGEVLDAWVDKPTDCPQGMTAAGPGKCFDEGDPRLYGGNIGPTAPTAPAKPAGPTPESQLRYTGDPLHDALAEMFNTRAGIFGTKNPFLAGATSRAGKEDITGMFLPGGGLWWGGQSDLASALSPLGLAKGTVPASQQKPGQAPGPMPAVPVLPSQSDPTLSQALNPFRLPKPPRRRGPLETALFQTGMAV